MQKFKIQTRSYEKMNKVFLDGHFLCGKKHGIAIYLEELYLSLLKNNSEIELIIGVEKNTNINTNSLFNHPKVKVKFYRFGGWLRFFYDIPLLTFKTKPKYVHTQNIICMFRQKSVKYHVTLFDVLYEDFPEFFSFSYRFFRSLIFRYSAINCDYLSTCSKYSSERICHHYGISKNKISIINGALNIPSTSNLEDIKYKNYFLYVSRFEKRKNHEALLKAFAKSLKNDLTLKLILVGFEVDGSKKESRKIVNQLKIYDSVVFLENISNSLLIALYKNASMVIFPSKCEGFGLPVIEALYMNPYSIFSDSSAMSDLKFAQDSMFNPYDQNSIYEKIESVLKTKDRFTKNWNIKIDYINKNFNWENSSKVLNDIYMNIKKY